MLQEQDSRRPLLYVAAPYTRPDPVTNTHFVCRVAMIVYEQTNWCPVVPHLSLVWQAVTPRSEPHWYEYDLHLMRRCNAIVRLPGFSIGADREIEVAAECGMRIVDFVDLPEEAVSAWSNRPFAIPAEDLDLRR